jgi:uncharacterized membrane protein
MKKIIYLLALVATACTGPKYTTSFYYYDKAPRNTDRETPVLTEESKLVVSETLVASIAQEPVVIPTPREEVRKTYMQMNKSERRELRQQLKTDMKNYVKEHKKHFKAESVQATAAMDNDLKMAAIFGAVGIVAMFIGTDVFWIIGGIALIIGVVFFIKWLVRQ